MYIQHATPSDMLDDLLLNHSLTKLEISKIICASVNTINQTLRESRMAEELKGKQVAALARLYVRLNAFERRRVKA